MGEIPASSTDAQELPAPKVLRTTYAIGAEPASLSRLGTPYQVWRERCAGNRPPQVSDIDVVEDFIGNHDRIAMGEVQGDQIICRLLGTAFQELVGRDITGENFLDQMTADNRPALMAYFDAVLKSQHIGHAIGSLPVRDREFLHFETLDLPLLEGDKVTRVLAVLMVIRD